MAAAGSKMLRLVARFADGWNWWSVEHDGAEEALRPIIDELELACGEVGRDSATLERSLDVYTIDPLNLAGTEEPSGMGELISGSPARIAETLLGFGGIGFHEVRCDVYPKTIEGIEAMADIVELVHAG